MIEQHGILEISRARLRHNVEVLRNRAGGGVRFCATVKADAYGHGAAPVMAVLAEMGIEWLAVYGVAEVRGLNLSSGAFKVLVLAPTVICADRPDVGDLLALVGGMGSGQIRLNLTDQYSAHALSVATVAAGLRRRIPVHVQVDTGLTRAGADPAEAEAIATAAASLPGLALEGVFAHFSHGDVPGHPTLEAQRAALAHVAVPLKKRYPELLVHLQNSGGAFHVDAAGLDMIRIGIAMYGLQPSMRHPVAGLRPVAELVAPVLAIHQRRANTGVGYGHTFITSRASRLAIVPVGYADGYPRQLSNHKNAVAQVRGVDVPVVGRVSMDQIILDVTDVPAVAVGERVTVISNDATRTNSLDQMADAIGTLNYELATHFGRRLKRVVVD